MTIEIFLNGGSDTTIQTITLILDLEEGDCCKPAPDISYMEDDLKKSVVRFVSCSKTINAAAGYQKALLFEIFLASSDVDYFLRCTRLVEDVNI